MEYAVSDRLKFLYFLFSVPCSFYCAEPRSLVANEIIRRTSEDKFKEALNIKLVLH